MENISAYHGQCNTRHIWWELFVVTGKQHWFKSHLHSIQKGTRLTVQVSSVFFSFHWILVHKIHQGAPVNSTTLAITHHLISLNCGGLATCDVRCHGSNFGLMVWFLVVSMMSTRHCAGRWWFHNGVEYVHMVWVGLADLFKLSTGYWLLCRTAVQAFALVHKLHVFQQCQAAKKVVWWEFQWMLWLSHSPDLSPIEHLWNSI